MDGLSLNQDVAARLVAAERAIDAALEAQAALVGRLVTARAQAGVSSAAGAAAIARAAAATARLAAARSETVACHRLLAQVRDELGLPVVAVGQGDKDPPEPLQPHKPRAQEEERRRA